MKTVTPNSRDKRISVPEETVKKKPSRRDFLRKTTSVKGVVEHKQAFDEAVDAEELQTFDMG